jgi:hypothetical protein
MVRSLSCFVCAVLVALGSCVAIAQTSAGDQAQSQQFMNAGSSTGVSPYHRPPVAHYRLLGGFGGNLGLASEAPRAMIGVASYQIGEITHDLSDCLIAAFISNASTGGYPRKSFNEFDVLYGFGINEEVTGYESAPRFFHASLSAGLGFDTYSTRWRHSGRGVVDTTAQPNTFAYSVGLPIQLQASYEPFRFVGIGALLFLNVNAISPNYGAAVMLEVRY